FLTEPVTPDSAEGANARDREIAQLSFNFVLDVTGHGIPGLKTLEALLMMAINQANIARLTREPAARSRYGALETPAPDEERRPVSVRAVAASMRLPYETTRRNIRRMESAGVCVMTEGGVLVPEAYLLTPSYFEAARVGHEGLLSLYLRLRGRGLLEPLPASNFPDEREPPVRAAVRLLSDYLLRTAEAVVGRTGELISGLVLLPVLAAAAGADARGPNAALPVAALARRVQLPAETVRRHAAALVAMGLCESGRGGITLADAGLVSPAWRSLLRENAIAVQRMFAGLAERGVVDVWDQLGGLTSERTQGAA
ncbi:MAG: hypothetical protein JWQ97_1963, partial [Phenylobacterium sp.]|nr:hypothetical protein [Phenylobacterium sp.]